MEQHEIQVCNTRFRKRRDVTNVVHAVPGDFRATDLATSAHHGTVYQSEAKHERDSTAPGSRLGCVACRVRRCKRAALADLLVSVSRESGHQESALRCPLCAN